MQAPDRQAWVHMGLLFGLGLVLHSLLAWAIDAPAQWDSAYAWEVGRNLARGEGSVTRAVWALAWLPPAVEHPADLHWMPLPSRVIVPALWVHPGWRAAQVVPVLIAGLWGPLGWLWARRIGLEGGWRLAAGAMAATGLGAVAFLPVPDSVGLFGVLGGGALLAAAEGRLLGCVVLAALAALTRGDGFWVGLACAIAFPGVRALAPAVAGVAMTAAWNLRNYAIAGEGFVHLRQRVSGAGATGDLLLLSGPDAPGLLDRILGAAGALPQGVVLFVLEGGLLPVVFAGVALFMRRRDRGLWPLLVLPALVLIGDPLLAPGVAGQGTTWRTLAALLPAIAALGLSGSTAVLRGLPRLLLPGVVGVGGVALSVGISLRMHAPFPVPEDCAALAEAGVPPDAPVLVTEPIQVAARCGRPAVQIPPGHASEGIRLLADRYDIHWLVVAPEAHRVQAWRGSSLELPGWQPVAGSRVWRRQESRAPTAPGTPRPAR